MPPFETDTDKIALFTLDQRPPTPTQPPNANGQQ